MPIYSPTPCTFESVFAKNGKSIHSKDSISVCVDNTSQLHILKLAELVKLVQEEISENKNCGKSFSIVIFVSNPCPINNEKASFVDTSFMAFPPFLKCDFLEKLSEPKVDQLSKIIDKTLMKKDVFKELENCEVSFNGIIVVCFAILVVITYFTQVKNRILFKKKYNYNTLRN